MIYTPNNNNFVQSSTAEYGGFYASTYTSLTQEYAKIFNTSKTDDTVKKWTTTPHNYTEKNYKCLWNTLGNLTETQKHNKRQQASTIFT